jgi:D-3-phosphoglycerate dehydrogenase
MKILSLAPLAGPGLDALRALGDVDLDPWTAHAPPKLHSADELVARCGGVDVLLVEADHVSAAVLENTSLRALGVCRGDPVNVDLPAATKLGIAVVRAPGRNAGAVADLTIAMMFGLLRHVVSADQDVRAGRFVVDGTIPQQRYLGREIASCTVGLVGYGAVGRAVAQRLRALGARVRAFDPYATDLEDAAESVGELFETCDIVSVHAPIGPDTRGMIGAAEFKRAKPGTLFVNTARFGIADGDALLAALQDGTLGGAALDHFENEFLPADSPFTSLPNVILTPHIGGSTIETVETHTSMIANALFEVLEGRAHPFLVNPEVLTQRT